MQRCGRQVTWCPLTLKIRQQTGASRQIKGGRDIEAKLARGGQITAITEGCQHVIQRRGVRVRRRGNSGAQQTGQANQPGQIT